jgi:hypothetical protein
MKKYFTYRICVNNDKRVHIEKYDSERQLLGRPSGDFLYPENRAEIQQLLADNQFRQLGESLFKSLFDPGLRQDILNFYSQSVQREEQLLRIELDIDETIMPEVAALPWEFLCFPEACHQGTVWLATDPNLVFLRYRALWNSAKPIQLALCSYSMPEAN